MVKDLSLDEHKKFAFKLCDITPCGMCPYRHENSILHEMENKCFTFTPKEIKSGKAINFMNETRNELILHLYELPNAQANLVRKYYLEKE